MIHFKETSYGFEYGAAKVTRIHSDEKQGWVWMEVDTPKEQINIYVTKTGKIRVYKNKKSKGNMITGTVELK